MTPVRILRAFFAVIVGLSITLTAVVIILTLGPVFRLACWPFRWRNPIELVPAYWGHAVTLICYEWIMDVDIHRHISIGRIDRDRPVILMCNHPSVLAVPLFMSAAAHAIGPRLVGVGRWEILYIPFIGWPLWIINAAIFIRRNNPVQAFDELRRKLPLAVAKGAVVYIFPDKHRPTYAAIERDRAYYKDRIDGIAHWRYTPAPRSGGLNELMQAGGPRTVVINMTLGFSVYDGDYLRPDVLVGQTFHVIAAADYSLSPDPKILQGQLNNAWKRKNHYLRRWRTSRAP